MKSPHFLRIARALALLGTGSLSLAACSAPAPATDAATDASTDQPAPEASTPDALAPSDATADSATEAGPDASSATDGAASDGATDARPTQDASSDVASSDGATDGANSDGATPCPSAPPMNGAVCTTAGQSCNWSDMSMFTTCMCQGGAWSCATAVPGPLPPPELAA